MSNLEIDPVATPCRSAGDLGSTVEFFEARDVPLGGVRGINVKRVLPQRSLPTIGAWCFLDVFGPHPDGMTVLPHPHIGLQTVTWPLGGEIRHRDSIGSDVVLKPGQLNLMTSGRGISHSEFSLGDGIQHGLQLWVALPADSAQVAPGFEQHVEPPAFERDGLTATVFMGELGGVQSPATVYTPLTGAQIEGTGGTIPLRPDFEYGLMLIDGQAEVDVAGAGAIGLAAGPLLYLGTGRTELTLSAPAGMRAVLLGGEPFPDDLVMWWNFVGRSHDEIAAARADWEGADPVRFGRIPAHGDDRIPAPPLPGLKLKPRKRRT